MFCRGCLELHLAQEGQQCLHQVGELARAAGDDFLANRAWNCSAGLGPATSPLIDRRYREDIRGARIERRVEVYQVHAVRGHVVTEDFEVVAEIEPILPAHLCRSITLAGSAWSEHRPSNSEEDAAGCASTSWSRRPHR